MDRNGASTSHDVFMDDMTKASIPHVFMNVSIWAEFATPHMMIDIILKKMNLNQTDIGGRYHSLFIQSFGPLCKVMENEDQRFLGLFLLWLKKHREEMLKDKDNRKSL